MNWVGKDEWGGLAPSQPLKDRPAPPHWRLEAIAATPRPYNLRVNPAGDGASVTIDRADLGSDIWSWDAASGRLTQLTVDRGPSPFWEDTPGVISCDGEWLAYASEGWVLVAPAGGGPSRKLIEAGSPVWLPDGRLVVGIDRRRRLTDTELPTVVEVTRLAVIDPADPWPTVLTGAEADAGFAVVSPDGARLAAVVFPPDDRNRSDIIVVDLGAGSVTTVYGTSGSHAHSPAWSPDGSRIAFVSEEPGWYEVHVVPATGGDATRLTQGEADFGGLSWSADGGRLLATRTRRGRSDLVEVDVTSGTVEELAPGGTWSDPAYLADGSVIAVYEDHRTPARIELVRPDRRIVAEHTPAEIASAPHTTPVEVWYRSGDAEIHGFLFRPPRIDEDRGAPVVVYPHGGPTSHYGDDWDGHAQYFIDKGYGWFAINFRGSTSYGRDFERSAHGLWGIADTEDCLAAASYLAGLDWVDPTRIAIFGASYGSYMAVTSLAADPLHLFACGVAKYGDSDILTSWAQGDRGGSEDLERQMGHPSKEGPAYLAGSPIHRATEIERPLLIAHGEKDQRVHPKQSEELVKELKRLDKTFEYVTYPTEGHGLLRVEPQIDFYRRLERFLDWYLL